MANKVKVPGGAFYAGDGLTVDPITKTVSVGGGGGGVGGTTTVEVYADVSADPIKYTSNMTGADILKAAANGPIVGAINYGTEKVSLNYVGSFLKYESDTEYAAFCSIIYGESPGKLSQMYLLVPSDGKTIEQFSYVFEKADPSP